MKKKTMRAGVRRANATKPATATTSKPRRKAVQACARCIELQREIARLEDEIDELYMNFDAARHGAYRGGLA